MIRGQGGLYSKVKRVPDALWNGRPDDMDPGMPGRRRKRFRLWPEAKKCWERMPRVPWHGRKSPVVFRSDREWTGPPERKERIRCPFGNAIIVEIQWSVPLRLRFAPLARQNASLWMFRVTSPTVEAPGLLTLILRCTGRTINPTRNSRMRFQDSGRPGVHDARRDGVLR